MRQRPTVLDVHAGAASFDEFVSVDESLAAVDVVGRAGDGGVRHQVNGESRDVDRPHDAADRQGGAQLLAPGLDRCVLREVRRRQRGVDEGGLDEVDARWRQLQGKRRAR